MEVTVQLVEKLAHLARLHFTEEEMQHYRKDLQNMVSFVEQLNEVNTENITPTLHMGDAVNALREDVVAGSIDQQTALKNAPLADSTFFKVPKVIKK